MGINKTPGYVWYIGIVVIVAIIFFAVQIFSTEKVDDLVNENYIEGNILSVGDYRYTRTSNTPSHTCPTSWESVHFNLDGREFSIYSVRRTKGPAIDIAEEGVAETCYSTGTPLELYLKNCVQEQVGSDDLSRPIYSYTCTGDLSVEILDSEKFESCMAEDSCELLNGVDVLML